MSLSLDSRPERERELGVWVAAVYDGLLAFGGTVPREGGRYGQDLQYNGQPQPHPGHSWAVGGLKTMNDRSGITLKLEHSFKL